jgi:hypothetical protein
VAEAHYIEGRGRYSLAEVVGRGGFATVWRARTLSGGADVAVKVIPVYSAGERSRAMREGQIAGGLKHKNIVQIIEIIPGDTEVYLITEFVRGLPLDEAARGFDIEQLIEALSQILEALVYAHGQGIIHRDIKPQNALVDERGVVKLTDFGVAYRAGDTRLTRVGFAVGTPGYIAPEILDGADPSVLTDIYAVGATARTLLARQPDEPTPRLKEFVDRATSPNPAHRPQSAWAALKLLTSRRVPASAGREGPSRKTAAGPLASGRFAGQSLRLVNGAAAAWLGYLLGAQFFALPGAEAVGIAAGLGVAGYLLPRLAALGLVVALAVTLVRNGVGLAVGAGLLGAGWVALGGSLNGGVGRLPLGPTLAVPLAVVGLGAGLPFFFGALMRPLGAALSAAAGALALIFYEISLGDGDIPFVGGPFRKLPADIGPVDLVERVERVFTVVPETTFLVLLWASMAAVVSMAEWAGKWVVGLGLAVGAGALGYALLVSTEPTLLTEAMTSLGLAAIMYAVLRYLAMRARG